MRREKEGVIWAHLQKMVSSLLGEASEQISGPKFLCYLFLAHLPHAVQGM